MMAPHILASGQRVPVLGITGGMGAGKSMACAYLTSKGAAIIEADQIGHQVIAPGQPGHQAVIDAFGTGVLMPDGTINRQELASIVFSSAQQLERLNAISHPLIRAEMQRQVQTLENAPRPPSVIVIAAALLFEAGWNDLCNQVWAISTTTADAMRRLVMFRHFTPEQAISRMQRQLKDDVRNQKADVVISNSGSLDALHAQLDRHWADLFGTLQIDVSKIR